MRKWIFKDDSFYTHCKGECKISLMQLTQIAPYTQNLFRVVPIAMTYIVGDDNGQKTFVVGVDGHVKSEGLQQHDGRMQSHVGNSNKKVEENTKMLSLPSPRFCGCPKQGVQSVLAKC